MIAITGGNNPIGQYLIEQLVKQEKQLKVLCSNPIEDNNFVTTIKGDIFDITALESLLDGVEKVYHLDILDTFRNTANKEMYHHNIEGTANVVNMSIISGVKKVLLNSSILSLGEKSDHPFFDESAKWNDIKLASGFGWSMHLAEREMWRGASEGLQALILHPGVVVCNSVQYGSSSEILQYCMWKRQTHPCGNIQVLDSQDLIRIMIELMDGPHFNEQYVVYGNQLSYKELGEKISHFFGRNPPKKELSYIYLKNRAFLQRFNFLKQHNRPMLTKSLAQALSDPRSFSNQKISQILSSGFIDIDVTIQRYCGLYNEQRGII